MYPSFLSHRFVRGWQRNLSLLAALGFLLTLVPLPVLAAADKQDADVSDNDTSDTEMRRAVESALNLDAAIPAHLIDVSVRNGIVTLNGRVDNLLAKDLAANDAGA